MERTLENGLTATNKGRVQEAGRASARASERAVGQASERPDGQASERTVKRANGRVRNVTFENVLANRYNYRTGQAHITCMRVNPTKINTAERAKV